MIRHNIERLDLSDSLFPVIALLHVFFVRFEAGSS